MTSLDDIRVKAEATIEDAKNMTPEGLAAGMSRRTFLPLIFR